MFIRLFIVSHGSDSYLLADVEKKHSVIQVRTKHPCKYIQELVLMGLALKASLICYFFSDQKELKTIDATYELIETCIPTGAFSWPNHNSSVKLTAIKLFQGRSNSCHGASNYLQSNRNFFAVIFKFPKVRI